MPKSNTGPLPRPLPIEFFAETREAAGSERLALRIGPLALLLDGIPDEAAKRLRERFGPFASDRAAAAGAIGLRVGAAARDYFIAPRPDERNPIAIACDGHRVRYLGYRLAGWFDTVEGRGAAVLSRGEFEPAERALENYLRAAVAWTAAERGGALVHAASAVLDGRGYLFYGESGAGKSTLSACNRRARVVSDDLSVVLPGPDGRPELVGSPFRGTYEGGAPVIGRFPLAAGFRLVQASRAEVRPVSRVRALGELVGNLPFVAEAFSVRPDLFARVERAFAEVPLAHLHFARDDSYWDAVLATPGARG